MEKPNPNDPRCEWVMLVDQDDDQGIVQLPCNKPALWGATISPHRYALWLCDTHMDDWLEVERMRRAG